MDIPWFWAYNSPDGPPVLLCGVRLFGRDAATVGRDGSNEPWIRATVLRLVGRAPSPTTSALPERNK